MPAWLNNRMPIRIIAILVAVACGFIALYMRQSVKEPLIVSGTVEADEIRVGSRVGGRVKEVPVEEGTEIKKGDVLVRLEPYDLESRLAEARAEHAAAVQRFERLKAGFRFEEIAAAKGLRDKAKAAYEEAVAGPRKQEKDEARENLRLAQAEAELAQLTFQRVESLYGRKAASKEELDQASSVRKVSLAQVDARSARLDMLNEGTRPEQIAAAKASLDAAEAEYQLKQAGNRIEDRQEAEAKMRAAAAAVDAIAAQIAELSIASPCDGVVEAIDLEPGDLVAPNAPVAAIVDRRAIWIRAFVPGKHHGLIERGRELRIAIDGLPGETFKGRVTFIARQAEFTPSNAQTSDERSKQVFRFKAELDDPGGKVLPGMTATVYLEEGAP